jgi:hypothetical protein
MTSGAQTRRRGHARAGEAVAWRRGLTGRFALFSFRDTNPEDNAFSREVIALRDRRP